MYSDVKKNLLDFIDVYIGDDMKRLDDVIAKELLDTEIDKVNDAIYNIMSNKGKRLRPIIVILICRLFDISDPDKYIKVAAAIEIIHNATLLHDDVVDESKLRRGNLTANEIFGNKISVLTGDFLLSNAFNSIINFSNLEVAKVISSAAATIVQGELFQLHYKDSGVNIDENIYLKIITKKTAVLFAAAAKVGAIIAGQSISVCNKIYDFGLNVGIAFQIIDDILDYCKLEKYTGKARGDDFKEKKITIPFIILYNTVAKHEREILIDNFGNMDCFPEILDQMHEHDIRNIVIKRAEKYLSIAEQSIAGLGNNEIRMAIQIMLSFIIKRNS